METIGPSMDQALKRMEREHCYKILSIDLNTDEYEVLKVGDYEWNRKETEINSTKLSDWLDWFVNGPLCHEIDRERLRRFIDPERLKRAVHSQQSEELRIAYRRKFDLSDKIFTTVFMEILPTETRNGECKALLFGNNISAELWACKQNAKENQRITSNAPEQNTILIIEDNLLNLEILTELLSPYYIVLQAKNGAEGLEVLQHHLAEISIIILDVQMPVMDGYEFLKMVKSDPFMEEIPVVVATSLDNQDEERKCLALGAFDFVPKPYNADIIRSRLANIIRLRESTATMSLLQTDDRTGLYTLQAFYHYARLTIDRYTDTDLSVIIFDIERFKVFNDIYGEEKGNQILQDIALVLKDYTAASDIFGCFGSARFLLLKEHLPEDKMDEWIESMFSSMRDACGLNGITFRAGIYHITDRSLSVSVMCDRAINALSSIGHEYVNRYAYYDSQLEEQEKKMAQLEVDMREAYEQEQFSVYYQPKHDAHTGKLVGAEALIRWMHPEFGFLSPAEFIPLFERNGFIIMSDYYVWKKTCLNLRKWMDEGIAVVPISVNASKRDFDVENHIQYCMDAVKESNINPELLHIEVTETLFTDNLEEVNKILQTCRKAGFKIELDDFGTGYSSLNTWHLCH